MREKQYRLFGKIGVLDILIVLFLIVAIVTMFNSVANTDVSAATGKEEIRYSVLIAKKDALLEDNLIAGMSVFDSLKGSKIGTLVSYEMVAHKTYKPDLATGKIVVSEVEGLYDYIVVISTPADISESAIAVGNYEVAVGKEMFVKTKTFASQCFCVEITIGGDNNEQ